MKTKLKIGDEVRCIRIFSGNYLKDEVGVVIHIVNRTMNPIGVEFEKRIDNGHDCSMRGKMGHCRWGNIEELEIVYGTADEFNKYCFKKI